MDISEKQLEFLYQHIDFLLEIEPLIPKVKKFIYKKHTLQFVDEYLKNNLWDDYEVTKKINDILVVNKQYRGDRFFHLALYAGGDDSNAYYGIVGNRNKFKLEFDELQNLKNEIEKHDTSMWTHWLGYKYFESRKQEDILDLISSGKGLMNFYKSWDEEFWLFGNSVKQLLETTNEAILQKNA